MKINFLEPCEARFFLESVSECYIPNPYHLYPQISKTLKSLLFKNEISSLIQEDSLIWTSEKTDQRGLVIYTPCVFDSGILGYPVGRLSLFISDPLNIELVIPLIDRFLKYVMGHGIKLVTLRINNILHDVIRLLMCRGFLKLDNFLTYVVSSAQSSKSIHLPSIYPVNLYSKEDMDPFLKIAEKAFHFDHFHSDPFIDNQKSNEIFIHWIRNALQGHLGSKVLYAHEGGIPLAFFSCRPRSEICSNLNIRIWGRGLAAVDFNSKGAYIALVNEALKRSPDYCDLMEFETQASNLMVLRIWAKYQFKLVSSFSTLHWHPLQSM